MWKAMWYISVLAILVTDLRTGAIQNEGIGPHRCFQCPSPNTTSTCDFHNKVTILCPVQKPYCGSVATGPNFTSILTCLDAMESPCLLTLIAVGTYEMSCICSGHLCNAPYASDIQKELVNFTKMIIPNNTNALTEFLKTIKLENTTDLYAFITMNSSKEFKKYSTYSTSSAITKFTAVPVINGQNKNDIPHAEPLKHGATIPPDDDEDESEGSGSYDEAKSQRPPSAPAAPSSFLPADDNKATPLFKKTLALTIIVTCYLL